MNSVEIDTVCVQPESIISPRSLPRATVTLRLSPTWDCKWTWLLLLEHIYLANTHTNTQVFVRGLVSLLTKPPEELFIIRCSARKKIFNNHNNNNKRASNNKPLSHNVKNCQETLWHHLNVYDLSFSLVLSLCRSRCFHFSARVPFSTLIHSIS